MRKVNQEVDVWQKGFTRRRKDAKGKRERGRLARIGKTSIQPAHGHSVSSLCGIGILPMILGHHRQDADATLISKRGVSILPAFVRGFDVLMKVGGAC